MPGAEKQDVSIDAIEREIAAGTQWLAFAPVIEAAFDRKSERRRLRKFTVTGVAAAILYDIFIVVDWLTLNDMFSAMVIARLGIFTPLVIAAFFLAHRYRVSFVRESLALAISTLGVLLPMVIMIFSESPYKLNYQYGSLLVMMFTTVVQQLRFRAAVLALLLMVGIQLFTTYLSGAFDNETYLGIVLFFVTASFLLALTTYYLEHSERRSFLFAMRGELLREQIEAGARLDPLTGLFNRRHLAEVSGEIWSAGGGEPRIVSAILLDLDQFKLFNDSRGHIEGDGCLRIVSGCIATIAHDRRCLAFRFGGEEMLVLLPDIGTAQATRIAESIRVAIEAAAIPHPAIGGVVTASLGVAGTFVSEMKIDDLLAAADTALYAAKRDGRNRVFPKAYHPSPKFNDVPATAA